MRRALVLTVVLLCLAVLVVQVPAALRAAPPGQTDPTTFILLPGLFNRGRLTDLPTPFYEDPWPTATTTNTPQPSATPTLYVPPTLPPVPTETPDIEEGAVIAGQLLANDEPLLEGLGDGIGPGLFVQRCTPADECTWVARTAVDAEGRFAFTVDPWLEGGDYYQVVWWNASEFLEDLELLGDFAYLGRWFSPKFDTLDPGQRIEIPPIELADFALLDPNHGSGHGGFPVSFRWARWPGKGGTYRWSLCKCCQELSQRSRAYQVRTSTRTEYDVMSLPPGFHWEERYCWYIQVDMGEERGYGETYFVRMMWFMEMRADGPGLPARTVRVQDAPRCGPPGEPSGAAAAGDFGLSLPLLWNRGRLSDLAPLRTAAPTLPPTPITPTATRTIAVPPTLTPPPTWTPEPTEPPVPSRIFGRITADGEDLEEGYGGPGDPQIELRRCTRLDEALCPLAEWEIVRKALIGAQGAYEFRSPPALEEGQVYQVWWVNDTTDEYQGNFEYLNRWWSRPIEAFGPGDEIEVPTFDVIDVKLLKIDHDMSHSLPIDFEWQVRRIPSETYRWSLFRGCGDLANRETAYRTPSLGRKGKYQLTSPPPGFYLNEKYCWYPFIEDATAGSGWPYFDRRVTFLPTPSQAWRVAGYLTTMPR